MGQPRRIPLLSLACFAASLSGCFDGGKGGGEPPEGLSGQVRLGGRPAGETLVRAFPVDYLPGADDADSEAFWSATTGADGVFAFPDIPAGDYNILATRNGLSAFLDSVAVTGSDQSLPGLTLGQPGVLVGQVELQPHHSTLGSRVEAVGTPVFAEVDEDGGFELDGLPSGTYRLRARTGLPDYEPAFHAAAIPAGAADTLAAPLRPPYAGTPFPGLSGRIRDAYGDAAVGAEVAAYPADYVPGDTAKAVFTATTVAGGIYAMKDIPRGVYNILASRHAWKSYRGGVEVTGASQNLPPDTLKLTGILGGRVIMEAGHPAIAAVVQVIGTPVSATVDDDGRFQLPPLAPGTYRLRAHSTLLDYAPDHQDVVIASGTGSLLEQPLKPAYSGAPARLLIGRLWNDRGPDVGAKVWACPLDLVPGDTAADSSAAADACHTTLTGAGGIYAFTDVPAGTYNFLIGSSIYRDSVTVTGTIQSLPFETGRFSRQLAGLVLLQPHHSAKTARVQVLGTPVFAQVREDSTFQLPLGPGTYRLRVHTSLPEYSLIIREVVHSGIGSGRETFQPPFSGIPVVFGLAAERGPKGTVIFSWNKPDYGGVEGYLVYRDSVGDTARSETPFARVPRADTVFIDTVYSRTPRAGQYDYADSTFHEHAYRVRILADSGAMGPLFFEARAMATPPALVDTLPPAMDPDP